MRKNSKEEKETLAAEIRRILGVDNVRFEKLSKEELEITLNALRELMTMRRRVEGEVAEEPKGGLLGLGILPEIINRARQTAPQIRQELQSLVDEIIFTKGRKRK